HRRQRVTIEREARDDEAGNRDIGGAHQPREPGRRAAARKDEEKGSVAEGSQRDNGIEVAPSGQREQRHRDFEEDDDPEAYRGDETLTRDARSNQRMIWLGEERRVHPIGDVPEREQAARHVARAQASMRSALLWESGPA